LSSGASSSFPSTFVIAELGLVLEVERLALQRIRIICWLQVHIREKGHVERSLAKLPLGDRLAPHCIGTSHDAEVQRAQCRLVLMRKKFLERVKRVGHECYPRNGEDFIG
jgi:hypothetical protein